MSEANPSVVDILYPCHPSRRGLRILRMHKSLLRMRINIISAPSTLILRSLFMSFKLTNRRLEGWASDSKVSICKGSAS